MTEEINIIPVIPISPEPREESDPDPNDPTLNPDLITMVILFNKETQAINVNGPINDAILSFGMLECAKNALKDYHDKLKASQIIKPNVNGHNIMNFIRGKK